MKKILLLCAIVVAVAACKKDEKQGGLDPNAPVYINAAPGVKAEAPNRPTAREVVERANGILFNGSGGMGFGDQSRDLVNNRIILPKGAITNADGTLATEFTGGQNVLFVRAIPLEPVDTLAYIPNAVMREAGKKISDAYNSGNLDLCYTLFKEAFVFTPITGAQWRALKEKGEQ